MKQGGNDLTDPELYMIMGRIGRDTFRGLEGIDAESTAAYFDDALESLVQQYGYWEQGPYNIDNEYNRRDFRDEAVRRALWAILVVQGYAPYATESSFGNWSGWDEDAAMRTTEFTANSRNYARQAAEIIDAVPPAPVSDDPRDDPIDDEV